ncbi:MAG: hypothetical protein JHD16_06705 [Solirubrobacteraceae bacterium]|nr:hypothetical protein [Solirubrobacteraceae bacterium]
MLVSLAVRRFGPQIGGLFGGLPVVAGPILLVYALEQGDAFAAQAAASSLVALVGLTAFVVYVAVLGPRLGAVGSVVTGWGVFCAVAFLVALPELSPVAGLALCCVTFTVALATMPRPAPGEHPGVPQRPRYDLTLRASVAAAMVLVLTSVAAQLGPLASGVLAPFPTITSVLAGFATAHETRPTTLHLLRNMIRSFFSFAAFLFTVAVAVEPWGTAAAFTGAVGVMLAVQAGLWLLAPRSARDPR